MALLNKKVDFFKIRKEFGDLFWYKHERYVFNKEKHYKEINFDDFLSLMNDYYLIKYSTSLNRNAWLVFNWLIMLSRNDGFIIISYNEFSDMFFKENKISKPTFYKCIDELVEFNLICKIPTYKVYNENLTKDKNAYAIVNKCEYIHKICNLIQEDKLSVIEAINYLDNPVKKESNKDEKPKIKNSTMIKMLNRKLEPICETLNDFFDFLGSFNATGKIADTRRVNIMKELVNYTKKGFDFETIEDALNITMRNTASGGNNKKERYMLAILKSQSNSKNVADNEKAGKLSQKANDKILEKNKESYEAESGLTHSEYKQMLNKVLNPRNKYYEFIIRKFESGRKNEYEDKLYKVAKCIRIKLLARQDNQAIEKQRRRYLFNEYNICEAFDVHKNLDREYYWFYEDDEDNLISPKYISELLSKNNMNIQLTKYDKIKEV